MTAPVRWGVLGAAHIALDKVIPSMQKGELCEVVAIASRSIEKAQAAATRLGIQRFYGSYDDLLADPSIEAVYNPLPNHLHVPWSIRAVEAGKHVLCEKPIALTAAEARSLLAARDRYGVLVQEAFMVRTHPQWLLVRDLVRAGELGELRLVSGTFSYFNRDPANVRNDPAIGGGALYDIGCYPVTLARFLFDAEPERVLSLIDRDPDLGIDRMTSGLLRFPRGQATFTCSTQLVSYQRVQVLGTRRRLEVAIPFNAPSDRPMRLLIDDGSDLTGDEITVRDVPPCDQYTIQGDLFSRAIRSGAAAPVPLEDAVANMDVLDALFRSAKSEGWETPGSVGD